MTYQNFKDVRWPPGTVCNYNCRYKNICAIANAYPCLETTARPCIQKMQNGGNRESGIVVEVHYATSVEIEDVGCCRHEFFLFVVDVQTH